jgi:hypothetical protein
VEDCEVVVIGPRMQAGTTHTHTHTWLDDLRHPLT